MTWVVVTVPAPFELGNAAVLSFDRRKRYAVWVVVTVPAPVELGNAAVLSFDRRKRYGVLLLIWRLIIDMASYYDVTGFLKSSARRVGASPEFFLIWVLEETSCEFFWMLFGGLGYVVRVSPAW